MDFSEFLKKKSYLPPIPIEYYENADLKDDRFFNCWLREFPENDREIIIERLKYIRKYTLQYPDPGYDMEWEPPMTPYNHYEIRNIKLKNTGLSEQEFFEFDILQEAIKDLGLSPTATFEFILFLWDELKKWLYIGKTNFIEDRLKEVIKRMEEYPEDKIELDIRIGKKHFIFNNEKFVKSLIVVFLNADISYGNQIETAFPMKREIDYILVKTLLDKLPIKHSKEKKGNYTQSERNFALCVLWLTGELNHKKSDDPYFFCTKENNATFDKLMRDYKGLVPPPIIPIF